MADRITWRDHSRPRQGDRCRPCVRWKLDANLTTQWIRDLMAEKWPLFSEGLTGAQMVDSLDYVIHLDLHGHLHGRRL